MPDLTEYQKEKEEFEDALDEIFTSDESDEDINKKLDGDDKGDGTEGSTGDHQDADADDAGDDDSLVTDGLVNGQDVDPATKDKDTEDWKARCLYAEAELEKERQKTKSWDGRITAANNRAKAAEARVAELEDKLSTAGSSEQTDEELSDAEKIKRFRDDFPELGEVIDIMERKISKSSAGDKSVKATDYDTSDPDQPAADATKKDTSHMDAIIKVHPEVNELAGTGVLLTWINRQGDHIKPYLLKVYSKGTAEQVIKMITAFKEETNWVSQLNTGSKARAKQDKLKSMTEVDSHSAGPTNEGPDKNDYDQGAKDAGL